MSHSKFLVAAIVFISCFSSTSFVSVQATPVDINSADARTLADSLAGIGPAKAQAIVDYRTVNGEFKSINELSLVNGIGERTVLKNRDDIVLNAEQLAQKTSLKDSPAAELKDLNAEKDELKK